MSNIKKNRNRRKLGSRKYKDYSTEMLDIAVQLVKQKSISSRQAEQQFGIPRRSILNKVRNLHMKTIGGQMKLTDTEEEKLVKVLVAAGEYGCPMTKLDLKMLVYNYLEKNSRLDIFNGKMPGNTWVNQFLNRHSSKLSVRTTQNIKQVRAEKGLQELQNFFANLQETIKDIPPSHILNYDETNLSDNPGNAKCIFRRGTKYPERVVNSSKSSVSIMFTVSAAGDCLPTYVVYKSINLYSEWVDGGPPSTRFNCTKSGWFDSACFDDYFKTIILPWAKNLPGSKVIIGDNLSSHLNIEVIELCQEYQIKFVFLPPNSTHLTQPLDVAFFGPLKREWRKILLNYKISNPGQSTINKKHFPKLLAKLLKNINLRGIENIKSGFKATGICPVNAQNVLKRIPEYFDQNVYEIDSVLLDYLQKTRSPKPMAVKRSKKLNTEPGMSVCAADISIPTNSTDKNVKNKKPKRTLLHENQEVQLSDTETMLQDSEINILQQRKTTKLLENMKVLRKYDNIEERDEVYILDERTGDLVRNTPQDIESMEEPEYENIIFPFNNSLNLQSVSSQHLYTNIKNPDCLSQICISVINNHMTSSVQNISSKSPNYVHVFSNKIKGDIQNMPFRVIDDNTQLSTKQPNVIITSNVKLNCNQRKTKIPYKIYDSGAKVITQSALSMKISTKDRINKINYDTSSQTDTNQTNSKQNCEYKTKDCRKTTKFSRVKGEKKSIKKKIKSRKIPVLKKSLKKYFRESSPETDLELSLLESDDSEYESFNEYINYTCLQDQTDKENLESHIPMGISDIEYFTGNAHDLKEGDWLIVKFATKKSLKHYVGRILFIKDSTPTVNFLRKVKNTVSSFTFTYPTVEDVCEIHHVDDIVVVLPQPTITRRGQVVFEVDFSGYKIQ